MSTSLAALQASYANSALATSANLIGKIVEDGSLDTAGLLKSYEVQTVENVDGELYLNALQLTGYADRLYDTTTKAYAKYDSNGYILDSNGAKTEIQVQMKDGRFVPSSSGGITLLDKDGKTITDATTIAKYVTDGASVTYASSPTKILVSSIKEIW
jgi:hypothetical protein